MKLLSSLFACALLAACAVTPERNPLATWVASPNHNARAPVLIVIHGTEQNSMQRSIDTLRSRNSGGRVSAHYLIGRDGKRVQLVADAHRAWHAGAGRWGTITDVNSASIGIEMDNNGHAEFPEVQIASLLVLLEDLTTRLHIPKRQVIAHADMAPTRKRDPSRLFPWETLAQAGFGRWPSAADLARADAALVAAAGGMDTPADGAPLLPGFDPWLALAAIGYPLEDRIAALQAFRRHFRGLDPDPSANDISREDLRILHALAAQLRDEAGDMSAAR